MPVSEEFHVTPQTMAVPIVIVAAHLARNVLLSYVLNHIGEVSATGVSVPLI
jgi:hypothetical protein